MNHCVPELNMDEDYSLHSPSGLPRQKNMQEDEIMELLWQNGQVVVQSQNPRLVRKSPPPPPPSTSHSTDTTTHLFMQEDEMNNWLQDPSFDREFTNLFYHPPPPPPHPRHQTPVTPPSTNNGPIQSTTVVDSSDTPAMGHKSKVYPPRRNAVEASCGGGNRACGSFSGAAAAGTSLAGGGGSGCLSISMSRDGETCELTLSGDDVSASAAATADLMTLPPVADRKRKAREPADDATAEYQSEDVEIESHDAKKQSHGSNTKRSRAAEVHNLSERKRRDRINEKMKALQELIPRCTKTDKASMLDEAIEYLKSLQLQVQMMSMGCGMVPMMFPGVQQYMPRMGMGMGMEMGMTRPIMPFPGVLSGTTPGAASHMNPRFPLQAFPMPPIPGPDPSRIQQAINQTDASGNLLGIPGHNMARIPNLADPYQQCMGIQHMPMHIPQNHTSLQPSDCKASTNRGGDGDNKKHPSG